MKKVEVLKCLKNLKDFHFSIILNGSFTASPWDFFITTKGKTHLKASLLKSLYGNFYQSGKRNKIPQ